MNANTFQSGIWLRKVVKIAFGLESHPSCSWFFVILRNNFMSQLREPFKIPNFFRTGSCEGLVMRKSWANFAVLLKKAPKFCARTFTTSCSPIKCLLCYHTTTKCSIFHKSRSPTNQNKTGRHCTWDLLTPCF